MVEMRRRTVAKGAAQKFFSFPRAGGGDISKASFGGNRSEAGRYAANIRWQGQTVDSPPLVGYSESMTNAEGLKSQLHILASTTDTKLWELDLQRQSAEKKFYFYVNSINKQAKLFEPYQGSKHTRGAYQHDEMQQQKHFAHFLNATPEERQRIIDLALANAKSHEQSFLASNIAKLAPAEAEIARLQTEMKPLLDLFGANQWSRFFLVTNTNGHVHRSLNCSTTYPTTTWAWLPHLSGLTDKEAVDDQGGILCTHCFPDAPSDYTSGESRAKREGREQRAEEKRVRDEKKFAKKITADGSDVRLTSIRTSTDNRTGEQYAETETISSITGAKEFLRDAMEYKRLPKPSYLGASWTDDQWKDGTSGLHTDENVAVIAGLLSEKTGDSVEKILDDAEIRARKYRNQ